MEPGSFANMGNLTHLLMHYSAIEEIEADTFVGAPNLEILWLHNNEIEALHEDAFNGLGSRLKELTLGDNKFDSLNAGQFDELNGLKRLSVPLNMSDVECDAICDVPTTTQLETADCAESCITQDVLQCGTGEMCGDSGTCGGREEYACCVDDNNLNSETGRCDELPEKFPYTKGLDASCKSFGSYDTNCIDRVFGSASRVGFGAVLMAMVMIMMVSVVLF